MRVAVLSDIHSNLEALDAVLTHARDEGAEALWVLGDIVGYGADPHAVIERLAGNALLLGGNHDLATVGRFDIAWFNTVAATALRWTAQEVSESDRAFLRALEPRGDAPDALLVHGSVVDPVAEYVTGTHIAAASFDTEDFALCFFGHTHLPVLYRSDGARVRGFVLDDGETVTAEPRSMINPGSVGQPRDGDPRASYLLYDGDASKAVLHRVAYDVEGAQRKIRAAGLPAVLADRLALGR